MQSRHCPSQQQINFLRQLKQYSVQYQQLMVKLSSIANKYYSMDISNQQWKQVTHRRSLSHFQENDKCSLRNQIQKTMQKLQLQIQKYKQIVVKVQNKIITKGGINGLKKYVEGNYNLIIRQCYHVISVCENRIRLPKKQDLQKLRQYEHEMDRHWDTLIQSKYKINNNQNVNTTNSFNNILTQNLNANQTQPLKKRAVSQINKQFLAIRLLAYKLYEQYNGHSHDNLHKELYILREQETKIQKQIEQMKQVKTHLQSQEAKIWKQLMEIKKINELIGRRHFISDERTHLNNNF